MCCERSAIFTFSFQGLCCGLFLFSFEGVAQKNLAELRQLTALLFRLGEKRSLEAFGDSDGDRCFFQLRHNGMTMYTP
jgi:hypothetical protein